MDELAKSCPIPHSQIEELSCSFLTDTRALLFFVHEQSYYFSNDRRALLFLVDGKRSSLILYERIEEVSYSVFTNRRVSVFFIQNDGALEFSSKGQRRSPILD